MLNLIDYHKKEFNLGASFLGDRKCAFRFNLEGLPNPYIPIFNFISQAENLESKGLILADIYAKHNIKIEAKMKRKKLNSTKDDDTEEAWITIFPSVKKAETLKDTIKETLYCQLLHKVMADRFTADHALAEKELENQAENFI